MQCGRTRAQDLAGDLSSTTFSYTEVGVSSGVFSVTTGRARLMSTSPGKVNLAYTHLPWVTNGHFHIVLNP